jgi:NADPH-dependent curcumin reductase CurA
MTLTRTAFKGSHRHLARQSTSSILQPRAGVVLSRVSVWSAHPRKTTCARWTVPLAVAVTLGAVMTAVTVVAVVEVVAATMEVTAAVVVVVSVTAAACVCQRGVHHRGFVLHWFAESCASTTKGVSIIC